jgi:hypothetical protein
MSLLIGNRKAEQRAAHRLFAFSISYLFLLFAALLVDHTSDPHSSQLHPRPVGLGAGFGPVEPQPYRIQAVHLSAGIRKGEL